MGFGVPEDMTDPIAEFHEHLDKCEQCRNQPFNLCPEGSRVIQKGVDALGENLPSLFPVTMGIPPFGIPND